MTVALRSICRDYPAGGGILRELLQNADDAGASSVRLVLDLNSYPTDNLLHADLAQYQGPALLAYNSAVFPPKDFESLSRVGDSRKLRDGYSTGKFGRGFNSVYNWTDSPSIVSKDNLLILDAHHRWSASFPNCTNPGGPMWDFVANAGEVEMKNQMSAFSAIMEVSDKPFDGTIIRIPLRTASQAEASEICKRPTTASDVKEVMRKFASEFEISGLLFMKNIESIKIEIGGAVDSNIKIYNTEHVRMHRRLVNEMIRTASTEPEKPFELSFDVEIESESPTAKIRTSFAVHHSIASHPTEEKLRDWCNAQAMIPWIAVAAQIPADAPGMNNGSLFTVLPLQIPTNQPVHIHGLFSLSPDRARIHGSSDSSVQDQLPAQWNEWLFARPIPTAWVNMLLHVAQQDPERAAFAKWPLTVANHNDVLHGIIQKVLQIVQDKSCQIWYTDLGYTSSNLGLLANGDESPALRRALRDVGTPMIYLPDTLFPTVQSSNLVERLNPTSLCGRLEKSGHQVRALIESAKQVLLEYILLDPSFRGYGAIEIFPFEDGTYQSIDRRVAFVHRDEDEHALFGRELHLNISLGKLSKKAIHALRNGLLRSSLHSSLRQRSSNDLKSYCLSTYFNNFDPSQDFVCLDEDMKAFVSKVWDWIVARGYSLPEVDVSCLWLVPLSNGQHRKLKPQNPSSGTIYAPPGEIGDFLRKMATIDAVSNKPIVFSDNLSSHALKLFVDASVNDSSLLVKNGGVLEDFTFWLNNIHQAIERASNDDKLHLQELLVSHRHLCGDIPTISSALRGLKIFQKLTWMPGNDLEPCFSWTSLNGYSEVIGLPGNVPVPDGTNVLFVDAKLEDTRRFLTEFQLAACPCTMSLLEDFMVLFWESGHFESLSIRCREHIARLFLSHFYNFERGTRERLASLSFLPLSSIDGKSVSKFATAAQLIDSSNHLLRSLFFDDEEVFPAEWVMDEYKGVAIACGLRERLTEDLVKGRIKYFANDHGDTERTWGRARKLLQSKVEWSSGADTELPAILRELEWLPAIDCHGKKVIANATQCRGLDDQSLVGLVHSLVLFDITGDWKQRLGWNGAIPITTLLAQLERGIEKEDRKVVHAVLKYFQGEGQVEIFYRELMDLRCVLTQSGCFVSPRMTFHTGCERLEPYLYNIDNSFWYDNSSLLQRLEIKEKPDLENLLQVQSEFQPRKEAEEEASLKEADVAVQIEIIKLAAVFDRDLLSTLMIVSAIGSLCTLEDATYNDLGPFSSVQGTTNFTHPDIPYSIVAKLRIEPLSERIKKGQLGLADIDDDEFDQHEEVADGINDTLERYPVEATFKEYLANADDAGSATQINWLLDARQHPQVSLVTPELSAYQGPALVVHNDGTFREKDFEGLKHVGRGSKRDDPSTIGKFGRGSQTMYHWTDVPMLLSGSYVVVLDPLRHVLHMNYRTGRRMPGVKIELSRLKSTCPDQLAPFDGLWGYSREREFYEGTIFRFPLRPSTAHSRLRESKTPLDYNAAQQYMEEFLDVARISLIFLRNVRSINFKVYGERHPRWSVKSSSRGLEYDFSDWTVCTVTKGNGLDGGTTIEDRWRTAIQDPAEFPAELLHRHRRTMKDVQCGMAALVSPMLAGKDAKLYAAPKSRIFSSLPLPLQWDLPVNVHATFITFGDRNSITIESSAREDGADWNRWLLTSAIPSLYLHFLEDLARKLGQDAFRLWPKQVPPKGSLSELVYTSFWQQLPSSSCRLFPLARQLGSKKKRQPPKVLEIKEATFDFLSSETSELLRDILESQVPTLVRVPFIKLQSLESRITSVTPRLLREIFRSEAAAEYLVKSNSKLKILEVLLKEIMPKTDADFEELDGCRVLPLMDGTLGVLSIVDRSKPTLTYYVAGKRERELFDFASELLTPMNQGNDFRVKLLNHQQKFNIKELDLSDFGTLLGKKDFQANSSAAEFDAWLQRFWEFWHEKEIHSKGAITLMSGSGVHNYPILRATCDGTKTYLKLSELKNLPLVVEPANEQHQKIWDKIPGLYKINSKYMPLYLKSAEGSLRDASSFARLIKSLSMLAVRQAGGLENYIRTIFADVELEILRRLVKNYFDLDPPDPFHIKDRLKILPIWPTVGASHPCIAAGTALVPADYRLLRPWMSEYGQFVQPGIATSYSSTLKSLGVQKRADTTLLETNILPHLPQTVAPSAEKDYELFISALSRVCEANHPQNFSHKNKNGERRQFINLMSVSRLAPDGNGVLHPASALFDHGDHIFQAAFREEVAKRFLMTAVRGRKRFWLDIGLKQRSDSNFVKDYALCLQTMRKRLEAWNTPPLNHQLASDAQAVLEPLTSSLLSAISGFSESEWLTVRKEATFPALTALNSQPSYRRDSMAALAASKLLLSLEDIIKSQYVPICWSQTSFSSIEPSEMAFHKITLHGRPPISMVWRHLNHLMQSAENLTEDAIPSFLSDLASTYDFLQDNLHQSSNSFTHATSPLWLNLPITDDALVHLEDLQSSWLKIEHLVLLSPCDSPPLMSVQPRLMRHERLLRALGCRTIVYPSIIGPDIGMGESLSASMTRMRHEGKMLDITLSADGKDVQAHKVVLAAASAYFAANFDGNWAKDKRINLKDISFRTLSMVVDFTYADIFDWMPMRVTDEDAVDVIADRLDDLLDLLTAADRFLMPALTIQAEGELLKAGRSFIRIDNVLDIRTRAAEANAHYLENACAEFYEKNKVPVDLVYSSRSTW